MKKSGGIATYHKYLYGYVNGKKIAIKNMSKQIVAFIMNYKDTDTMITTILDKPVLSTTIGGFIMDCPDQIFLMEQILPILVPVQMGVKKAPKFIRGKID